VKAIGGWPPKYLSKVSPTDYGKSRGEQVIDFAETLCKITKDSVAGNAGQPLIFRDWQKELTRNLFAVNAKGILKHKIALIGLPRKQGKSAWLSSLALEHLVLGPSGGEIYSCAADRDQAKIVFGTAKEMIRLESELQFLDVYRDAIYNPKNGTTYRALSAEAFTKEGLSPTFVAFDELHAQPNRELFDVMSLAMGARQNPMLVAITTAGVKTESSGKDSLCYDLYNYGKRIVSGEVKDPSFFFAWYEGDESIDYRTEKSWKIANPGYGDICAADDFASAVLRTPEAEFKTKRLNIWTSTQTAWLSAGTWEALEDKTREPEPGEDVILAFDGAFSNDSTALVAWLLGGDKPHLMVVGLWERPVDADNTWHVPVAEVEQTIINTARDSRFSVREIVFDPARWQRTFMVLDEQGLPVVSYPNSAERMVPATQKFYEGIVNGSFTHDGDERLARHINNCVTKQSSRGVMVSKSNSKRKIDAAVASIFGYDRATSAPEAKAPVPKFFSLNL
jgi:phage terminase large subunit-like protein